MILGLKNVFFSQKCSPFQYLAGSRFSSFGCLSSQVAELSPKVPQLDPISQLQAFFYECSELDKFQPQYISKFRSNGCRVVWMVRRSESTISSPPPAPPPCLHWWQTSYHSGEELSWSNACYPSNILDMVNKYWSDWTDIWSEDIIEVCCKDPRTIEVTCAQEASHLFGHLAPV